MQSFSQQEREREKQRQNQFPLLCFEREIKLKKVLPTKIFSSTYGKSIKYLGNALCLLSFISSKHIFRIFIL